MKMNNGSIVLAPSEASEVLAILSLPIRHQGGFQNRLLNLSDLFNVEHPEAPARNKAERLHVGGNATAGRVSPQSEPATALATKAVHDGATDVDTIVKQIATARATELVNAGDLAGARRLLATLIGVNMPGTATEAVTDVDDMADTTDGAVPVKRRKSRKRAKAMRARWAAIHAGQLPDPRKGRKWTKAEVKAYASQQSA